MSDAFFTRPPLRLADGTLVHVNGNLTAPPPDVEKEEDEVRNEEEAVSSEFNAAALVVPVQKKLRDLPDQSKAMNGIAAVLAYSLFGLNDDDIAEIIGTTTSRIERLRNSPEFLGFRSSVITSVIHAEQDDVRELIAKNARKAVRTIVNGMDARKVSDKLKAAGDILDRSGFRPADVVEHRHKLEGGLTIEFVRKETSMPLVDIDINGE